MDLVTPETSKKNDNVSEHLEKSAAVSLDVRSGSSSHSKERGNAKVYKKPSLKEDKPTKRKLVFAEMDDDETPKRAFRAAKLRSVLCLDSPAGDIREKPSELPVQEKKQEKQKPTAAKSRPKSNARKPKISDAKKRSPKSSCSPKAKAVVSPKSSGSPKKAKKAVVSPKSSGSPKAKAVVSPKSGGSPKKAKAVSPKSGGSPKAKAVVSPKSGCSLVAKLGMKKTAMKKKEVKTDKSSMKNLKMTRAVRHMEEGFNLLGYAQPSAVFVDMEPAQFSRKRDASDLVLFFKEDKEISATMRHLKRGDKIDFTATMVEVGKRGAPHAMALWDVSLPSRPGDSPKANATQSAP
eukprot:s300_g14.t1